ncbi:MAG: STAS domain-containing protein [Deltaproteobacteria bacterium]|nr:STAS domain-containing protein [Deltaproteobacteria bacterium]
MSKIPIMKIEDFLLVSVQTELHDKLAEELQKDIVERLAKTNAKGVLIDVTALDVVDSFLGRLIGDTAGMTSIMGAKTVLVGVQPAVAITLVEFGIELRGIHTALNMEKGLQWLRKNV